MIQDVLSLSLKRVAYVHNNLYKLLWELWQLCLYKSDTESIMSSWHILLGSWTGVSKIQSHHYFYETWNVQSSLNDKINKCTKNFLKNPRNLALKIWGFINFSIENNKYNTHTKRQTYMHKRFLPSRVVHKINMKISVVLGSIVQKWSLDIHKSRCSPKATPTVLSQLQVLV